MILEHIRCMNKKYPIGLRKIGFLYRFFGINPKIGVINWLRRKKEVDSGANKDVW